MRSLAPTESGRAPVRRDRKIFSTLLLLSAAACMAMSALHIELRPSTIADMVVRGGSSVVEPLVAPIKRRTSW